MTAATPSCLCPLCGQQTGSLGSVELLGFVQSHKFKCPNCHTFFRNPLPSLEQMQRYHHEHPQHPPHEEASEVAQDQRQWIEEVLAKIGVASKLDYVEFGAGFGWLTHWMSRSHAVAGATGFESDPECLTWSKRHLDTPLSERASKEPGPRPEPRSGHLLSLSHVLEDVPNPLEVLEGIKAVAPGETYLFLEVPNGSRETGRLSADSFAHSTACLQLWSFSPEGLSLLLHQAGFDILRIESLGSRLYHKAALDNLKLLRETSNEQQNWLNAAGLTPRQSAKYFAKMAVQFIAIAAKEALLRPWTKYTRQPVLRVLAKRSTKSDQALA